MSRIEQTHQYQHFNSRTGDAHNLQKSSTIVKFVIKTTSTHQENQKRLNWSWAALNHLPRTFQARFFQDQSRQVVPLILGLICLGVS